MLHAAGAVTSAARAAGRAVFAQVAGVRAVLLVVHMPAEVLKTQSREAEAVSMLSSSIMAPCFVLYSSVTRRVECGVGSGSEQPDQQ